MTNQTYYSRYLALIFIGLANAIPLPLIGSTLTIWLAEIGFDKTSIGFFSLASLPFSLRFLWIPIIESAGLRKSWISVTLLTVATSLLAISFIDFFEHPILLASMISLLSIGMGGFYASGLAYELESLDSKFYSLGSSCITTGYRVGLVAAGAGALYLSLAIGWVDTYRFFAIILILMAIYFFILPEPFKSKSVRAERRIRVSRYNSRFYGFYKEMVIEPYHSFMRKPDWKIILLLLLFFKSGNQLMKSMEGPFYLALGIKKAEIATIVKLWGVIATISGSAIGGLYFKKKGHFSALKIVSWFNIIALGCFLLLSLVGKQILILYSAIALEHFVGGLAMTTFIFFLWRVSDKSFASIQYAMLWSVYSIKGDLLGCFGGFLANQMNWPCFFLIALIGATVSSFLINYILKNESFNLNEPIMQADLSK